MSQKHDMLCETMRNLLAIPMEYLPSVNQHLEALRGDKGEEWYRATNRFLRKENPWVDGKTESAGTQTRSGLIAQNLIISLCEEVCEQIDRWTDLYWKHFGIDLRNVICLPAHKPDFHRLIVVAQSVTANKAYDVCRALFPCERHVEDLDVATARNDRDPSFGTYAIWVRDSQEADTEMRNLSADELNTRKIPCITLLERLLLELYYFNQTGKHLDVQSVTICSGSRYVSGDVPLVLSRDEKMIVRWGYSDDSRDEGRAREVAS